MTKIVVTGAGGFIGHHLIKHLVKNGHFVIGVDIKRPEFETSNAHEFYNLDLTDSSTTKYFFDAIANDCTEVYHLAADMGGIGYITENLAQLVQNSTRMDLNILDSIKNTNRKILFTSSACVYNKTYQLDANVLPLKESDATPAMPEEGYGWGKLFTEKLLEWYRTDFMLETRIVRLHNVYGPLGTYTGGKEKAPAALCRKVAQATDRIDIWGDGNQTRSFMHVRDCVIGLEKIMNQSYNKPVNLGSNELISIKDLAHCIINYSKKNIQLVCDNTKPQGVRGRNSDNTLLKDITGGWEPKISIRDGIKEVYDWVKKQP